MIDYISNIRNSGVTIYDTTTLYNPQLYIPTEILEFILNNSLVGKSLLGLPLRTRSKVVKESICAALGYPIPKSFKKVQPRFPGQNFDIYTQKSLNVQVWNEEISPSRRYVFIRINEDDIITKTKVILGDELVTYDRTGTLTTKYQATMRSFGKNFLFSQNDTATLSGFTNASANLKNTNPNSLPTKDSLLPINVLYQRLLPLVGKEISHLNALQERNRGYELHKLICQYLGYSTFEDDGSYPDLYNQLAEIKLQTSPTIDLGLHSPLDGAIIFSSNSLLLRSADIRYIIFEGAVTGDKVLLKNLYIVNGRDFPQYFPLFQGKVQNAKLQLPLPQNFFD